MVSRLCLKGSLRPRVTVRGVSELEEEEGPPLGQAWQEATPEVSSASPGTRGAGSEHEGAGTVSGQMSSECLRGQG